MKTLKLTSLTLLSVLISACGSSGGAGKTELPDGDKLDLTLSPKGYIEYKSTEGILRGVNKQNSFYGAWVNDSKTVKSLHYQGTKTNNIPTAGIATYKGDAVYVSGYNHSLQRGGTTTLNVDFGNKTVDGTIKFSVLNGDEFRRDITLHKGMLAGADFSGKASVSGNSGGQYSGALFGDGAKEAAGLVKFSNNNNLDVAFGATRY